MIAIAATCWNEADSLESFLEGLLAQTLPADEIVIADGGSTDGTQEILKRMAAAHPQILGLCLPRSNRSVGRNVAIAAARSDIIAMTDAGSRAAPDWLEKITAPLLADPALDGCGGYFRPLATTPLQKAIVAATVVPAAAIDPETFLPFSRSFAFRKEAWARAGGYPEWADHNEDTVFSYEMRRAGCRLTFAPDAIVTYEVPRRLRVFFKQFFRYARGDAQARLWFGHYTKNYAIALGAAMLVAGAWWPPVAWAALAGGALYLGKKCLRAARRTHDPAAVAMTPLVQASLDLAHLAGYTVGVLNRPDIARRQADERVKG